MKEIQPNDIISCESESLKTIGFIQNHSFLVAINISDLSISHYSENLKKVLKEDINLLGKSVKDLDTALNTGVDNFSVENLLNVSLKENNLKLNNSYLITLKGISYYVIQNLVEETLIIEFEPCNSTVNSFESGNFVGEMLMKLNVSESDFDSLFDFVAKKVKELINYDRVMVYKFHEDFHGEVIAEAKNDDLNGFLGLHFPATDIPAQARELYVKNITRMLVDTNSEPIPIISKREDSLDLTYTQSRAISKMHIEYLKNMGVQASYSISLIVNNKLWGLIACHNYNKPGFIDFRRRSASKIISQYVSNLLAAYEGKIEGKEKSERLQLIDQLDKQMRDEWDVEKGLVKYPEVTLSLCDAEGFAIVRNDIITKSGATPSDSQISEIVQYLQSVKSLGDVYVETKLSNHLKSAESFANISSGLAVINLQKNLGEFIIWFKPEFIKNVKWGGKDKKNYVEEENGKFRLSPRKSFEKWEESVRLTSTPWTKMDVRTLQWLRNKVLSVSQHKANEISRLNTELSAAYEELDSFSYTLSHDLKTPLSIIKGYVEVLQEDLGEDDFILNKISRNADIMQQMVKNVLEYSKLGREPLKLEPVEVAPILSEIQQQMDDSRSFKNVCIKVSEDIVVPGNKMMLYQVFLNLIENAVKYKDSKKESFVKVETEEYSENLRLFKIIDNGLGINSKHFDKVFGLFKQGSNAADIEGSGVGLAIVKKIVTKHGGRVWVESTEGEGSTFYVLLNN